MRAAACLGACLGVIAAASATSLTPPAAAWGVAPGPPADALESSQPAPVLPPDVPPFGEARRARLATTALLFPVGDDDNAMDGGVYVLPVPLPWPPGYGSARSWELDVPSGAPVFALAAVSPASYGFTPGTVSVVVDGVAVPSPESYAVRGLQLPDMQGTAAYHALAYVIPGQEPGRHTVSLACNACTPAPANPWTSTVNGGPRTYVLNVQPAKVRAAVLSIAAVGPLPAPDPSAPTAQSTAPAPAAGGPAADTGDGTPAAPAPATRPEPGPPTTPPTASPDSALSTQHSALTTGTVADREFNSPALGRDMPYRVYLPPDYDQAPDGQPTKRFPVLYLLHGLGGSMRQWTRLGLDDELDQLAAAGQRIPFIVVMPTGRAGYWVNHPDGGPLWADYVAKDLVAHVDAAYHTVASREGRAIGGISMGAHGALQLTLNNPDVFGTIGAHSPALRQRAEAPTFLGGFFMNASGGPGQAAYDARDPITLVRRSPLAQPPRIWIDVGQQDGWVTRATELHNALAARGWAHEWRPAPGGHDNAYWKRHLAEYVAYYRAALLPTAQ